MGDEVNGLCGFCLFIPLPAVGNTKRVSAGKGLHMAQVSHNNKGMIFKCSIIGIPRRTSSREIFVTILWCHKESFESLWMVNGLICGFMGSLGFHCLQFYVLYKSTN